MAWGLGLSPSYLIKGGRAGKTDTNSDRTSPESLAIVDASTKLRKGLQVVVNEHRDDISTVVPVALAT